MAPKDQAPPSRPDETQAAGGRPFGVRAPTFGEIALKLFDNGYEPLPLKPGRKYPVLEQWSSLRIDEAAVRAWAAEFPRCGVGLRTGSLVGVDIDVMDPDLAHAAAEIVRARLGPTLLRIGWWPKRLLIYRTEQPFAKLAIHKCEILGLGQQMAAFGVHPDTGRPYYWPEDSPLDVPLENLPAADETCFRELLGELAQILPPGPSSQGKARRRGGSGGDSTSGPTFDETGRVVDGRDAYLSTIAFHAVHDALECGDPPDAAALRDLVWSRFSSNADLSRPKKDGSHFYGPDDAGRKVADKLKLLRDGRLPPRRPEHIEEPALAEHAPVTDARARLNSALAEACDRIFAWHRGESSADAPQIGVRATVGLGKSASARRHLLALRRRLLEVGAPSCILICTPSHALAEEVAVLWRETGLSVAVLRGYEARHPALRRKMCRDLEAVRAATSAGLDVQTAACIAPAGRTCAFFAGCLKQANRDEVAEADIVVAPYEALFTGFAGDLDTIGMILIDEGCWARAAIRQGGLHVETFAHALLNHGPDRSFGVAADLHDLRRRAAAAFEAAGTGPLARSVVRDAGLTADDALLALALERRRLRDPGLYPGMPQQERKAALAGAQINAASYLFIAFWKALHALITGSAETNGRIEIGAQDEKTGLREVTVLGVKPIHPKLRGRPVLHLDATLRPELAGAILPELEVTEIEAEAPFMHLRLVTGGFGKSGLCPDERADAAENARRANRLSDCVDYVRWHARRAARRSTLVVTYMDCETAFFGIPGVEVAHFNALTGLDAYRDVGLLVVIGRPLPRESDVRRMCATFFGEIPQGGYGFAERGVRMRNGQARSVRTMAHADLRAEVLRAAICDDEVVQAIGRGRGVNRTVDDPLEVHVLGDVALPLVHDRLLTWSTEAPDIVQRMLLAGLAVDSPSDAAALHPGLFGNEAQAQKAFERTGFRRQFPLSNIYREMSAKSAAYRHPGRGRSWQRTYWIDGDADDAKAALERAIGPLAEWKPG